MSKSIFVITPVRHIKPSWQAAIADYVGLMEEQGHTVFYPPRDTPQHDSVGLRICQTNRDAIAEADEVHIAWDGLSKGCLFDLGMAFALGKPVVPIVGFLPRATREKSFTSMIHAWAEETRLTTSRWRWKSR